jgi:AAA15 family ATPase/GTPase
VASDKSKEADLARIRFYRAELYRNITETGISDSEFEKYWSEISGVLLRLGGTSYNLDIERLKVETMDLELERSFIKTIEGWEELAQRLIKKLVEVLKVVKGNSIADDSQAKGMQTLCM